ncbi:TPA: restriction endonuclease subunit S [Streptococcus equi subsp. zooepidemicus]|nr:restriction endonuclease subunit S [Streptococcus equi subsp. zooepidemicus]
MFGELDKNTKKFPIRKLNEISAYWNGLTYKPADAVEAGNGTLVLRSSNIQDGALAFDDNVFVGCAIKEKLFVQDNDILMCSRNGSAALVGKTALIKGLTEPTTFGAFMMIIRSDYYSYLKTYFETPFFRNQISTGTSTINQITGKMLNEISLPVPDMDTVRLFEEFTHQSDKSKFVRFKSQFIEMFGELGKDQKGWGLTRLGECCEVNPKRPRNIDDELMVSFVPMPAVSEDGKIDCSDIKPYKEVRKGFTYFAENDVLFAKITPCMENGKGAVAKGLSGGIGSGSTEFHVLRPIEGKSNPYWLYIITMFESFRVGARKVMTGTGGQLRVPVGYLSDFPISLPPISLQNSFEEFVHQSDKSK